MSMCMSMCSRQHKETGRTYNLSKSAIKLASRKRAPDKSCEVCLWRVEIDPQLEVKNRRLDLEDLLFLLM